MVLLNFVSASRSDNHLPLHDGSTDRTNWNGAFQRRQQINDAQHHLLAPLTESRGFSEPMQMAPLAYRALLSEFEARRPNHTSPEPENGYCRTARPYLTSLRPTALAALDEALRPVVQQWAGVGALELTNIYGVRTYRRGATLEPHVDRVSHALSAIVQVSQESIAEPWPISIHDHDGTPHNLILQPGEMVLYESARLVHGRPQPLNGSSFSNVFVHYRPVGWQHAASQLDLPPQFTESLTKQPEIEMPTFGIGWSA